MKVITLKSVHFIINNDSLLNKNECYPFLREIFSFLSYFSFKVVKFITNFAT